eukprot:431491_1
MAELRIWGNLTNGEDRELTPRTDIVLTETDDTIILLQSDERLVTGQTVGTSDVTATLTGRQVSAERDNYTSNLVDFAVSDHLINLDTIELYTFIDRDHVFEDLINTRELLKLDATFSDGVIIPDILRKMVDDDLWPTTAISEVFTFTSTDPEVVSVDEDGFVEILDNWWRGVNITVQSQCSDAEAAELIYPNLKPDYWDVDVEEPYTETGLQFQNQRENETFLYNIYINATNGTLLSFSIRLWWHYHLFIEDDVWPQCYTSGDWRGLMFSWNIDTVRGELRLAAVSSAGSSTSSAVQHVATCSMRVRQAESNISMVVGQVLEISYLDAAANTINHVYNQPIVAGDGYQQINNGQTIKHVFPENVQRRYEKEQSLVYDCSASTGDECLFEGDGCSCCTEPVFGDVNFDCKHTAFDAQATTYYFIDATSAYGFSTILHMDLALSQRIAMDQSLDYLQDDINECAYGALNNPCPQGLEDTWYALQVSTGKFLYLNLSRRNQSLMQTGPVVKAIAPMFIQEYPNLFRYATDLDATVFFELNNVTASNLNGFVLEDSLSAGEVINATNTTIIIKGKYIENQYWMFETNAYNWSHNECFEMAIIYQTYSASAETQSDRKYAFRGSNYFDDSFVRFSELCIEIESESENKTVNETEWSNEPTNNPTLHPTSNPSVNMNSPLLVGCRFEDHGTAILAYFSEDTNRAGFGGKPFSCLAVWNPLSFNYIEGITQDSKCLWKDFKTMRIELGYGHQIRPRRNGSNSRLILGSKNIRDYTGSSAPVKGYCFVDQMFNPPPVFANIIGSTHLTHCDDLRLSATPTRGQAAPMTWQWLLTGNAFQDDNCVLGSEEIPNNEETLFIPNRCLISSTIYDNVVYFSIILVASNHYSFSSKTQRTVFLYFNDPQIPSIQLLTPSVVSITTQQDLIIPTFVKVDSKGDCREEDMISGDFSFLWSSLAYDMDIAASNINPFGSLFTEKLNAMDGKSTINDENFVALNISSTSSTLTIASNEFVAGKYYAFKVAVTYHNRTNHAFVGVIVSLATPYPRPSIKYQSIGKGSNITLNIYNLYHFYHENASNYGIEWNCFNSSQSILFDADSLNDQPIIVINEANANLMIGQMYNCSAHLFSRQRSNLNTTLSRQESYFVFEYIAITETNKRKLIGVKFSSNTIINRDKRIVISATFIDYYKGITTTDDGLQFDDYVYEWYNVGQNSDLESTVYGISIINHLDYEHGHTVNFVIDDTVNRFIYDGQKYGLELKVTSSNGSYGGYGQIEWTANRGPNGGQCSVELVASNNSMIYRVECHGWTDEYMETPLEYNFMLLYECHTDDDCKNELVCEKDTSEYDVGICVLRTLKLPIHTFLRQWTQGNIHYFRVKCEQDRDYVLRSFIRDYSGLITSFDTPFSVATIDNLNLNSTIREYLDEAQSARNQLSITATAQLLNAYGTLLDCSGRAATSYGRIGIAREMYALYNRSNRNLWDRFGDFNKIFALMMNELYFDALSMNTNTAHDAFGMIEDMLERAVTDTIWRELSVYQLTAMTWIGDAVVHKAKELVYKYYTKVLEINGLALRARLIDETHYNVSYNGLQLLSGWETASKFFSPDSDCGGDLVDLAGNYELSYFGGEDVDYVRCELIAFNGGMLTPTAISRYMSSPIIYWNLRGFKKDGTEIPTGGFDRRRDLIAIDTTINATLETANEYSIAFNVCSPFIYTIHHNANTSLLSYQQRRGKTEKQPFVPWSVCKTVLNLNLDSNLSAPTAVDCYVLTHDEEKSVCACNSNYTLLSVEEELYFPHFLGTLNRYNPDFSWTGLMKSVGAMLSVLLLLFVFTCAMYILPSYDKHKALLAVKKGLPKSQREETFFQTAEGKVFRAVHVNINHLSLCEVYSDVYRTRLRNDHLCLWCCFDDPGGNISHSIKLQLTIVYCLLFMYQIAWFYGKEQETVFADTLFAVLIAFETILPIWLCAWCISRVRPHELTDKEIEELVEEQMPFVTKQQKWEDEYESDDEEVQLQDDIQNENDNENDSDNDHVGDDILRIYTDIDEEMQVLEDNYMPNEQEWQKEKRVSYIPDEDENASSIESYQERQGFEGQNYYSHWDQAHDAAQFGFIPINDEEEYDAMASNMLNKDESEPTIASMNAPRPMQQDEIELTYAPFQLRRVGQLPERAPSQRPPRAKRTHIEDTVWIHSNLMYDGRVVMCEDQQQKSSRIGIDMDDIWEITGALPPELLSALKDPYNAWKEDEDLMAAIKPVIMNEDEKEEYRDKLTAHFKQRRRLLKGKYFLPRWCRYFIWLLLMFFIISLILLFLYEGNKLGAVFLWIPDEFDSANTECAISIKEQTRFDYDYSLDESQRRNPACSPQETEGSMPHCWDYRVRFTMSLLITFLSSMLLVQPIYIAILTLITVTCLPICMPCCVSIRNALLCRQSKDDAGYKHFVGGTLLISGDTELQYDHDSKNVPLLYN